MGIETLRPITEDEMVAVFLKAEADSERFSGLRDLMTRFQVDRAVGTPDLDDWRENAARAMLLAMHRGYRVGQALFHRFPPDMRWQRARMAREDLCRVRYINDPGWVELSGGSRLASDASRRIAAGHVDPQRSAPIRGLVHAIQQGRQVTEMILVGESPGEPLIVLEGHVRLTAYLLLPDTLDTGLEVIIGHSPQLRSWTFF